MRVVPIAATTLFDSTLSEITDGRYQPWFWAGRDDDDLVDGIDELAEFAGRNCYQAWGRKNPKTATNAGYLANILDHGHFSVLEHGSVTFYVDGISRSLTHELERHRHISFSELSQRYVSVEHAQFITPPDLFSLLKEENPDITWDQANANFREDKAAKEIVRAYNSIHSRVSAWLETKGVTGRHAKKRARQAARSVMPNCTETKLVVTGNLRAWLDVIGKRYHEDADEEIIQFAGEVLKHLRDFAPNSVQDIPDQPYGS